MNLTIQCPKCQMELDAPASLVGKPATCPGCQSQFLVSKSNDQKIGQSAARKNSGSKAISNKTKSGDRVKKRKNAEAIASPVPSNGGSSPFDPPTNAVPRSSVSEIEQTEVNAPQGTNNGRLFGSAAPSTGAAKFKGLGDAVEVDSNQSANQSEPSADPSKADSSREGPTKANDAIGESQEKSKRTSLKPEEYPASEEETDVNARKSRSERSKENSKRDQQLERDTSGKNRKRRAEKSRAKTQRPVVDRTVRSAKLVDESSINTNLKFGEDGTLPQLSVVDVESKEKKTESNSGSNPILLIAVLGASLFVSVLVLLAPSQSSTPESTSRAESLMHLEEHYFGAEPFEEYQLLLRQAVEYENRGERQQAKVIYRRVLDIIHSESFDEKRGLTGPAYNDEPPSDSDLEIHLQSLIRIRN